MALPISVIIVAKDEEAVIRDCLTSAQMCDEIIVVVDARTTDKTAKIAEENKAKVITQQFIDFSQIKNFALSQATKPWTLLLDADERISRELAESLQQVPEDKDHVGYQIAFRNHLRGAWLHYGGMYPDYHLRLFRTGDAHYEGIVHEKLKLKEGSVGTLKGDIIHMTYPTTQVLFRKVRAYAQLESTEHPKKGYVRATFHAVKRFLGVYVFRGGMFDGSNGLINALALAEYQYILHKPNP